MGGFNMRKGLQSRIWNVLYMAIAAVIVNKLLHHREDWFVLSINCAISYLIATIFAKKLATFKKELFHDIAIEVAIFLIAPLLLAFFTVAFNDILAEEDGIRNQIFYFISNFTIFSIIESILYAKLK